MQWFVGRDGGGDVRDPDEVRALCERWPHREGSGADAEAVAVTSALASPFAERDRILRALAAAGAVMEGSGEEPLDA